MYCVQSNGCRLIYYYVSAFLCLLDSLLLWIRLLLPWIIQKFRVGTKCLYSKVWLLTCCSFKVFTGPASGISCFAAWFWKTHCWWTLRRPHFLGGTPRDTESWILITIYMLHKGSCLFLQHLMWPFCWCLIIHVKNIWHHRCCNFPMLKQEIFSFHVCSFRAKYFLCLFGAKSISSLCRSSYVTVSNLCPCYQFKNKWVWG
jgi:hypothetical protein